MMHSYGRFCSYERTDPTVAVSQRLWKPQRGEEHGKCLHVEHMFL